LQDRLWGQDMNQKHYNHLPHADLTGVILECCFEVMNELGAGFLEAVYKNALVVTLKQRGLVVQVEQTFEVYFRRQKVGLYNSTLYNFDGQNEHSEQKLLHQSCTKSSIKLISLLKKRWLSN
jgi:hypothetical protein